MCSITRASLRIVLEPGFRARIDAIGGRLPKLKHLIVIGDEDAHLSFEKLVAVTSAYEPQHLVEDRDPVSYLCQRHHVGPRGRGVEPSRHLCRGTLHGIGGAPDGGDQVLAMLPLFHTTPLNTLCTPAIAAGATIHIRQGFEAEAVL